MMTRLWWCLTLLSFAWGEEIRYTGTLYCAQTGLPLDSVRIASVVTKKTAFSDRQGRFVLVLPDTPRQPDSCALYEYGLRGIGTAWGEMSFGRGGGPLTFTLHHLNGRLVEQKEWRGPVFRFPAWRLPAGAYVARVAGSAPMRVIVHGRSRYGGVYGRRLVNVVPEGPDTLVFCKRGYHAVREPLMHGLATDIVRLYPARWVASDIHNHTVLTDGVFIQDSVLRHAFGEGGLDVYANAEHGGMSWVDTAGVPIAESGAFRWYTLERQSWPKLLGQRVRYPGKVLMQGLEWNCPGHEHASVGFVDDADQPDAIAQFEYRFDAADYDTSLPWLTKTNGNEHKNALAALQWLEDHYASSSYCFINHPTRASADMYTVDAIRDFHTAAPTVFMGLEGMPGHQKNPARGGYAYSSFESGTFGGADIMIARIGGVWDALLGEGRRLWIIANSDFHYTGADFWPGEYIKTWTAVADTGGAAWLQGLRSGATFITTGDLLTGLEFSIDDGVFDAPMGAVLRSRSPTLTLTIRFRESLANNHGDSNRVDHIDLIAGAITGRKDPVDRSAYKDPENSTTRLNNRFFSKHWRIEGEWKVVRTVVQCSRPTYFRLRGTNLALGTPGELDSAGNPLPDEAFANSEDRAWQDLWFYSNPIFVYPAWR